MEKGRKRGKKEENGRRSGKRMDEKTKSGRKGKVKSEISSFSLLMYWRVLNAE